MIKVEFTRTAGHQMRLRQVRLTGQVPMAACASGPLHMDTLWGKHEQASASASAAEPPTPWHKELRKKVIPRLQRLGDEAGVASSDIRSKVVELEYEMKIRNHKAEAVTIKILEHVYGDWEILKETHPHQKRDARTIEFQVPVEPDAEATLAYRVRVRW